MLFRFMLNCIWWPLLSYCVGVFVLSVLSDIYHDGLVSLICDLFFSGLWETDPPLRIWGYVIPVLWEWSEFKWDLDWIHFSLFAGAIQLLLIMFVALESWHWKCTNHKSTYFSEKLVFVVGNARDWWALKAVDTIGNYSK